MQYTHFHTLLDKYTISHLQITHTHTHTYTNKQINDY